MSLKKELNKLRPKLAAAAQEIYEAWQPDEEGFDEELGTGGICDRVAEALASVINEALEINIDEGGQEGDDHAFLLVDNDVEAFIVDIPPGVYETGGGYNWAKREDITIEPGDVFISQVDLADIER